MEKIKNLFSVIKQDYEKALLVVVVVTLALAVGLLYWLSAEEQQRSESVRRDWKTRKVKEPPAVDMRPYAKALEVARNPERVDFGLPHKLFNPVKWMRGPEGRFIVDRSGKTVGPEALKIDSVRPLNRSLRLLSVLPDNAYSVEILFEASDRADARKPRLFTMKLDEKVRLGGGSPRNPSQLWLREVKGKPEDPDELIFELTETKERITVNKSQAAIRAEAYVMDLSYSPENRQFKNLRRDSVIAFGGEEYKIVDITENEVVVSNRLNDKKTRLKRTSSQK
ncbi:MAG: hypothetical protein HYR88_18705 [Verrucomicrobia bacterium]|nr:hypothetical protein [Verrucomicrobiota bacterium]MBI3870747.1 hypothetical protein [Verrucomicrobiota bacterium]